MKFMSNMLKKTICFLAAAIISCSACVSEVSAEVFTASISGGKTGSVYVAGNPDLYPIEYYDAVTETYMGLIPDMLEMVSEETGIDFTYISADKENKQRSLYKNNQVELVTAIMYDDAAFKDAEKITVLTAKDGGKTVKYCIVFTDVLDEATKEKIEKALAEISDSQKAGFIIDHAQTDIAASRRQRTIITAAVMAVLAAAAAIAAYIIMRKKKEAARLERMIDRNTGIGNADYYLYAFEHLISEQSKNLYSLAYIAFDTDAFGERKSGMTIGSIEKYAASKLNQYAAAMEYVSYAAEGTFLFLFQAESAATAEQRVSEILMGTNKYISELASGCDDLFKAGYCRFCEHMGVNAEAAVYNAKQGYAYAEKHNILYHIGSKMLTEWSKKSEALAMQLDDALKNGEFKTYMQFIMDGKTGKFCGAEVLSRWQNREYGLLKPYEYIDILTKTGKIVEHDYYMFEKACRRLEIWNKPPFNKLFLTCNFTRLSVSKPDFAEKLVGIASKYQFSYSRIVIEITEDALSINSQIISENVKRLSDFGFKVAIDDMGAGFSSLADIYDNEIDIVKIEREFISACTTERRKQMMSDIIALVHHAGAKVICEGIETAKQFSMLKAIDCDMMQGFYHSRVLPLSEFEKFFITVADEE